MRRILTPLAGLLLALSVVLPAGASVAAPTAAGAHPGPVATRPPRPRPVLLSNRSDGRKITVHRGTVIVVRLIHVRGEHYTLVWSEPGGEKPLRRLSADRSPSGNATAVFVTPHPGTGAITAYESCRPDPGYACFQIVRLFKVVVTVR